MVLVSSSRGLSRCHHACTMQASKPVTICSLNHSVVPEGSAWKAAHVRVEEPVAAKTRKNDVGGGGSSVQNSLAVSGNEIESTNQE